MKENKCYCRFCSCESLTVRIKEGHTKECFTVSKSKRYCFNKDETGCIIGGGVVPHDIPTCRVKEVHGSFQDKPFDYSKPKEKPLNHEQRRKQQRNSL